MLKEYVDFWKRGLDFKGRSRRREYWVSYLWNMSILYVLLGIAMMCLFGSIDATTEVMTTGTTFIVGIIFVVIALVFSFAMLIPQLAICIRRCHDVGLSGWIFGACILGCFLCGLGAIAWLVISFMDSKEDNKWGENPKNYNRYNGNGSIWLSIGVLVISIVLYVVLAVSGGVIAVIRSAAGDGEFAISTTEEFADNPTEEFTEEFDDDIEEIIPESEENTNQDEDTTYALLDEITGRPMYRLVNYDYDTTYENGADMSNVIYTFVEPEDYKVDTEYVTDTIGFADTLFFLENENGDTIQITCSVPSGIIGYYEPDNPSADITDMPNYEIKETNYLTTNNGDFGFDIYEYTYDENLKYFYAITYFMSDSSFVMEFPSSEAFDDVEEVKEFLSKNF